MAKVRDVLARIGDKPLVEALTERGYVVFTKGDSFGMAEHLEENHGYQCFTDMQADRAAEWLREEGYVVMDDLPRGAIDDGFELYRQRRADEFRHWLRAFFWSALGRIV